MKEITLDQIYDIWYKLNNNIYICNFLMDAAFIEVYAHLWKLKGCTNFYYAVNLFKEAGYKII